MLHSSKLANLLMLLSSALCLATVAQAGLKEKPPKGVELSGIWELDPYRSDDPTAVLDKAREDMNQSGGGGRRHGGGMRHGGGFGGGGGGFPGGGGGFPGGGRGSWGHGERGSSSDDDSGPHAHAGGSRSELLSDLARSPDKIAFQAADHNMKVSVDQNGTQSGTECAAGVKVAISDAAGDGERNCGWDGRAWVIETARGKSYTRTDRYELSKDGTTLTYETTATGSRLPKIKITRTYTVAPAVAPAASPHVESTAPARSGTKS